MVDPAPRPDGTVPPLPRPDELIRQSKRLAEIPGLIDAALRWQAETAGLRRDVERDAHDLATPRIWHDTIASLATTGWRMVSTAAPDAPFALLAAAAAALGLRIEPPAASAGTLDRVEKLVRAGGPAYIKLGQFIATAHGILPDEWVEAFAWCRDEAPPLRPGVAQKVIDHELGDRRKRLVHLDEEPLAAGSIGQVHRGRLDDGTEVVVKVRRPRLRQKFRADIETLAIAAAAAERLHAAARAANVRGFVELFAQLSLQELDFRLEASNLAESTAVLEDLGDGTILAPRPIPGMVTSRVLVMEFMPGVSYAKLPPGHGMDGDDLLYRGIKAVLQATLGYGIFHGDLHAGNVLIDPTDSAFSLVDFGITGRLTAQQRAGLVQFLAAFAASDARAQVAAMQVFGAIDADADIDKLIAQLQVELDSIEAREHGVVTFDELGVTLGRLIVVLSRNGFRMPKELVLFFKNLLYLSGFAAGVAPEADVLDVVRRILTELLATEGSALLAALEPPPET